MSQFAISNDLPQSRVDLFEELAKPILLALPFPLVSVERHDIRQGQLICLAMRVHFVIQQDATAPWNLVLSRHRGEILSPDHSRSEIRKRVRGYPDKKTQLQTERSRERRFYVRTPEKQRTYAEGDQIHCEAYSRK